MPGPAASPPPLTPGSCSRPLRGTPQDRPVASPQAWHNLGLALSSGLHGLAPWRYALKRIGGRFGSSALSYFLFLKTLLAFNALLLLPLLAFLAGVQAAFPPARPAPGPRFTGLELLTGRVRARWARPGRWVGTLLALPPLGGPPPRRGSGWAAGVGGAREARDGRGLCLVCCPAPASPVGALPLPLEAEGGSGVGSGQSP